jgi:hypothetical protein
MTEDVTAATPFVPLPSPSPERIDHRVWGIAA